MQLRKLGTPGMTTVDGTATLKRSKARGSAQAFPQGKLIVWFQRAQLHRWHGVATVAATYVGAWRCVLCKISRAHDPQLGL